MQIQDIGKQSLVLEAWFHTTFLSSPAFPLYLPLPLIHATTAFVQPSSVPLPIHIQPFSFISLGSRLLAGAGSDGPLQSTLPGSTPLLCHFFPF